MKKSEVLKLSDSELDQTIKIQGTDFDRKRKVPVKELDRIKKAYNRGLKTMAELASIYGVSVPAIRSIINGTRAKQFGSHDNGYKDMHDRADYKRNLVEVGKIKVAHIAG